VAEAMILQPERQIQEQASEENDHTYGELFYPRKK
jgi:hypothetical protein